MLQSYLDEQQNLGAVERFVSAQDVGVLSKAKSRYRDSIPIDRPATGEQYAFEVDLDRCTGCKACVTGCHSRNGLDDGEAWRQVGTVELCTEGCPTLQTVTSSCHHCVDPACLSGCPVLAYEKAPDTGVVRHLDDQCIGCQYCIMKCPYEVPQYDRSRGIVRKCDMCVGRLSAGEAPACVESCPTEAIRITVVDKAEAVVLAKGNFASIPGAPDTSYTAPTTTYKTARPLLPAAAATVRTVAAGQPHPALVFMLMLTQVSVGILLGERLLSMLVEGSLALPFTAGLAATAASLGALGLLAAILHLGRPRYAFRALLGWKTSWLSREVLVFGLYSPLTLVHAGMAFLAATQAAGGRVVGLPVSAEQISEASAWPATLVGICAVLCSSMVYVDTPRPAWATWRTTAKFVLTSVVVAALTLVVGGVLMRETAIVDFACGIVASALGFKLYVELGVFCSPSFVLAKRWKETAGLMTRVLRPVTVGRVQLALLGLGAVVSTAIVLGRGDGEAAVTQAGFACFLVLAGELSERFLFFASVAVPRMPGV